jgi:hypothetical protein
VDLEVNSSFILVVVVFVGPIGLLACVWFRTTTWMGWDGPCFRCVWLQS